MDGAGGGWGGEGCEGGERKGMGGAGVDGVGQGVRVEQEGKKSRLLLGSPHNQPALDQLIRDSGPPNYGGPSTAKLTLA